ncbi:MAG: hypothetical protein ACJ76N_25315 [Thermoanaerobaculia bacterium]
MSETSQSSNHGPLVLFGVGLLSVLFGLLLFVERYAAASLLFGRIFPVTGFEELKVVFVECGAIFSIAQGVLLFAAGLFVITRNGGSREVVAGPASR